MKTVWWLPELGRWWEEGPDPSENIRIIESCPRAIAVTNPEDVEPTLIVREAKFLLERMRAVVTVTNTYDKDYSR